MSNSPQKAPWLKSLQDAAERQAALLEAVTEELQQVQAQVPEPRRQEIQEMRMGRQPLSVSAYLRGQLQRIILAIEDAACDLRSGTEDEALNEVPALRPTEMLLNAVEASLEKPGP